MRKFLYCCACFVALALGLAPAQAATGFSIPTGYHVASWDRLGRGLDHIAVRYDGGDNSQTIHVARLEPDSPYQLRAVVGDQSLTGSLEKTSSMCARVHCLIGVNGDFFTPSSGEPTGGLSIFGQAIRSPEAARPQLHLDHGRLSLANESWIGQLTFDRGRTITLDGVNVPLHGGKISLYTAAWGQSTGHVAGVTELGVQIVYPGGPLVLGRDTRIRLISTQHTGDAPIPANGAILAGEGAGAAALDMLWGDITHQRTSPNALVQIKSSSPASDSIGGNPVLLQNGRLAFDPVNSSLIAQRHPRTIVGWNKQRETFLVAIDGRQPGYAAGMTLLEAANMMLRMGATDAINLDGGGSTTFVTHGGHVVNQPSGAIVDRSGTPTSVEYVAPTDHVLTHVERAVATALVVVPMPRRPRVIAPRVVHPVEVVLDRRFMPPSDEPAVAWGAALTASDGPTRARPIIAALTMQLLIAGELWLRRRHIIRKR